MNEYGDVDIKDLNSLKSFLMGEITALSNAVAEIVYSQPGNGIYTGFVVDHVKKGSKDEDRYGYGAIFVEVISLGIYKDAPAIAGQLRLLQGRFEVPPIGSVVKITSADHRMGMDLVYFGAGFLSRSDVYPTKVSEESVGFRPQIPQLPNVKVAQSKYIDKVRGTPEEFRILESSKNFMISENIADKTLRIDVNDGWKLDLVVGDGGELNLLNKTITSDSTGTGADITINSGSGGSVTIKSGSDSVENMVLGETLKSVLTDILDHITKLTVPTALGPSGTPINSAEFISDKTSLETILSKSNKAN